MIEHTLDIATEDGAMETFTCCPERGGPFPVVLLLMDAPGIREELRDMARRLGTVGYYVLLPNLTRPTRRRRCTTGVVTVTEEVEAPACSGQGQSDRLT